MHTRFFREPLAQKLLRQNALTIAAALASMLAIGLIFSLYLAQSHLRSETLYKAETLSGNLADSVAANDLKTMQTLLMNAAIAADLQSITVFDKDGKAFLAWTVRGQLIAPAGIPNATLSQRTQTSFEFKQVVASSPLRFSSAVVGQVEVRAGAWPIYRTALLWLLWCSMVSALITAIASYLLSLRQLEAVAPVLELTEVAEKAYALGDYSLRLPEHEQHELSQAAHYFNQLLERMEAWERDAHSEARERREAERRLAILDNHDSLTKLPNRHYFHRLLTNCVEDAVENKELAALMFIDLDNFKAINDEFGYDAGDLVVATIANRLCGLLRGTDTLCRVDGDEFAAILPQIGSVDIASTLAERLAEAVRQPMVLRGRQLTVTASIGIALCPLHAKEQRLFLHMTDLALQAAKADGSDTWRMFCQHYLNAATMRSATPPDQMESV